MTVKKLVELLKKEDQGSEIFAYLGAEQGWKIVELGRGDAIIGKSKDHWGNFVLLPIEIPSEFEPWAEE